VFNDFFLTTYIFAVPSEALRKTKNYVDIFAVVFKLTGTPTEYRYKKNKNSLNLRLIKV